MTPPTEYFAVRAADGSVAGLWRVRRTATGVHPEALSGGRWQPAPEMLAVYQDSFAEDLLSDAEAAEVARRLGARL